MGARQKKGIRLQNVGVDSSKADFQVNFMVEDEDRGRRVRGTRKFPNKVRGFDEFAAWMEKKRVAGVELTITMEATGCYHEALAYYLAERGYYVSVELPTKTKAYTRSLNVKTKTDKSDAGVLAQMGLERKLRRWQRPSEELYWIKKECRERERLLKLKTALTNQIHAEKHSAKPNGAMLVRTNALVDQIKRQIKELEKGLRDRVNSNKRLKEAVKRIIQTPGLGFVSLMTVIAETDGFALFKNRNQLTSFAGYDIIEKQSGSSINGRTRISKKGNSRIRRVLYMAAMTASQYNDEFKNLYTRVVERTRIPMKGNVAVQRKLLLLIYALYKKEEAYDPQYWTTQGDGSNKAGQGTTGSTK